eukprot:3933598-Rhodomonas_salina.1
MVQAAARAVQKQDKWVDHPQVGKLKFSKNWTHSFLERFGMHRKRVTADRKGTRLSDDEIQAVMQQIQQTITDNKILFNHPHSQLLESQQSKGGTDLLLVA